MNKSLPPIEVYVRNSFLLKKDDGGKTLGYLIGVRALQNQALQFQVLLTTGALFTGLPAHSICFDLNAPDRTLQECQHWDNISSNIDTLVYDTLLYMPCTVKVEPTGEIIKGEYLFTIDYVGDTDLSRNPTHWKMFHAIKSDEGNLHLYAQYRIKFMDTALCFEHKNEFPVYSFNETIWKVGS
jgi:hypothetical protein